VKLKLVFNTHEDEKKVIMELTQAQMEYAAKCFLTQILQYKYRTGHGEFGRFALLMEDVTYEEVR
jgi:hypothetical protein